MIDPIDLQGLLGWLRGRGGDTALVSYVAAELGSADPDAPLGVPWEDRELVLEGLLYQCCDPRVDERRLDGLGRVASRLGFDADALAVLIHSWLGISERRLRAYGLLGLPLEATPAEIKATHRVIAKALHPDRLSAADPEARQVAERLMARLNHARSLLQAPLEEELELDDPDDLGLDEPSFDAGLDEDDLPTESDFDLSDLLEECR